jgi:hypothetical protein
VTDPKKPEPRKFSRQMIVDFVDLMMLADQIVAEYKRRHEDTGEEAFVEELGFHDRVQLASTLMGLQMKDAMVDDADVRRAAFERMKELQAIQEAAEPTGGAYSPHAARERLKAVQEAVARGEAAVLRGQPSPGYAQVVRLEPEKIERAFSKVAEDHGVPNARARQFVKLLMNTPEGHQMLQLMLHDVVQHQREQQTTGEKARETLDTERR